MIYTIGYQRLTADTLQAIVERLDARLIDCRLKPVSRKAGFGWRQLTARLGDRYIRAGDSLGGLGQTTPAGIKWLVGQAWGPNLVLMCMEEAPGECHRHHTICGPHFPEATHIYQDELVTAGELQRAIDTDTDYKVTGSLSDLLQQPA